MSITSKLAVPKLMATILVLFILLVLSVGLNIWQVGEKARAVGKVTAELTAKLSATQATADADRSACEVINRSANASIAMLGEELTACRGQEQKVLEQRDLALRQRSRALKAAEGEAQMRRAAIEAIARDDESCSRSVCRALSDELLGTGTETRNQ